MATRAQQAQERDKGADPQAPAKVRFNSGNFKSSYVNFCNATSTREGVVLNRGGRNNWDRTQQDMEIEPSHRIVLSPFAAKRLHTLLAKLMTEYETRYGELKS